LPSRLTVPGTFEKLPNLFEAHSSLRALLTSTCEGKTTKRPLSLNLQGNCPRFIFNRTQPWSEECNLRRFRNADCHLGSLHHREAHRHAYLHLRSSCLGSERSSNSIHQRSRVGTKRNSSVHMPLLGREKGRSPRHRRSDDEFVVFLQGVSSPLKVVHTR
jgi:hypothetical protein